MAALRSLSVAGPGPQTWLYRLSLQSRFGCSLIPTAVSSARHSHNAVPRSANKSPGSTNNRPDRTQKTSSVNSKLLFANEGASENAVPNFDDVTLLGPPPEYPIQDDIDRLLQALRSSNLESAIKEWSYLWDLRCVSRLSPQDLEIISNSIRKILFGKNYPHLGRMALYQSAQFGHLKNMATEAASRGYGTGLYSFMLKLIGCGRPRDVVDSFEKCKQKMREFQGKNYEDLFSWDREKRLSARLEDTGDSQAGLQELMMSNIAAHTLLNDLDGTVLFSMLDSQIDFRSSATYNFTPIENALRACKSSHLYQQFRQNVDKFVLSLMCYHPNALVARITSLGTSRQYDKLYELYKKVLEASIGPDAFLKPKDLDDFGMSSRNIPLPPVIWLQFMKTFEWGSNIDKIIKMLDQDLPQRGLMPNGHFLSIAMLYMAIIAKRSGISPNKRSKARSMVDEYWRRLSVHNWHIEDGPFSRRIRTLSILSNLEPKLKSEITSLFEAAKDGHLGKIGPKTRAAFLEFYMRHTPNNQALGKAIQVFRVFPYDVENEGSGIDMAYAVFIRLLALGNWSSQEKLKAYKKVTTSLLATGYSLRTHLLGPLLSIQLQLLNIPMETMVNMTLDATVTPKHPEPGIQRWTKVLYGLLTKWTHASSPTLMESQAGLMILKRATSEQLYGVTRFREVGLFMSFLVPIAKATNLNVEQRQEFIDMALNIFPGGGKKNVSINMYMEIISHSFNRPDKAGYGEGIRRWKELRTLRDIPSIWWSKMLTLLIEHDKYDWALDLVRDAWNSKQVLATDGFWLRARSHGLTSELDLDDRLVIEQENLLRTQRTNQDSGKKWRSKEVIAFAEESVHDRDRTILEQAEENEVFEDDDDDEDSRWEAGEEDE
ncbi:uncharacterized protein I206_105806 [Kwoniella pini CBS 10737]|uniref:Uncharacterized protein n=1 Tax=Kwoniella pini CBS 10737 TaxID=1296096 RepID=A0A1B9I075_9TREE|nr:uncharacterized protein I206_04626 [Kwoniella pini CBS 10737]OCF48939.1 hypothetical protein I206_04626 [Kwoniella pini CBS 10737]